MHLVDVYCWIGHAGLGKIWWILIGCKEKILRSDGNNEIYSYQLLAVLI